MTAFLYLCSLVIKIQMLIKKLILVSHHSITKCIDIFFIVFLLALAIAKANHKTLQVELLEQNGALIEAIMDDVSKMDI